MSKAVSGAYNFTQVKGYKARSFTQMGKGLWFRAYSLRQVKLDVSWHTASGS